MCCQDDTSNPGVPFACGLTLEKLSAHTVDEEGNEAFVKDNPLSLLRKVTIACKHLIKSFSHSLHSCLQYMVLAEYVLSPTKGMFPILHAHLLHFIVQQGLDTSSHCRPHSLDALLSILTLVSHCGSPRRPGRTCSPTTGTSSSRLALQPTPPDLSRAVLPQELPLVQQIVCTL